MTALDSSHALENRPAACQAMNKDLCYSVTHTLPAYKLRWRAHAHAHVLFQTRLLLAYVALGGYYESSYHC